MDYLRFHGVASWTASGIPLLIYYLLLTGDNGSGNF